MWSTHRPRIVAGPAYSQCHRWVVWNLPRRSWRGLCTMSGRGQPPAKRKRLNLNLGRKRADLTPQPPQGRSQPVSCEDVACPSVTAVAVAAASTTQCMPMLSSVVALQVTTGSAAATGRAVTTASAVTAESAASLRLRKTATPVAAAAAATAAALMINAYEIDDNEQKQDDNPSCSRSSTAQQVRIPNHISEMRYISALQVVLVYCAMHNVSSTLIMRPASRSPTPPPLIACQIAMWPWWLQPIRRLCSIFWRPSGWIWHCPRVASPITPFPPCRRWCIRGVRSWACRPHRGWTLAPRGTRVTSALPAVIRQSNSEAQLSLHQHRASLCFSTLHLTWWPVGKPLVCG